jgi:hypothetical protein
MPWIIAHAAERSDIGSMAPGAVFVYAPDRAPPLVGRAINWGNFGAWIRGNDTPYAYAPLDASFSEYPKSGGGIRRSDIDGADMEDPHYSKVLLLWKES